MKNIKEKIYAVVIGAMALFLIYAAFSDFTTPVEEVTESDFETYEQQ